ncbi:hypothetical protein KC678_05865, partial [Candidatus Dojkabacteria bacterium]|nr:hypothetical protein [Candidatus Dojkabacteria bacterium]
MKLLSILVMIMLFGCEQPKSSSEVATITKTGNINELYGEYVSECIEGTNDGMISGGQIVTLVIGDESYWLTKIYADINCQNLSNLVMEIKHEINVEYDYTEVAGHLNYDINIEYMTTTVTAKHSAIIGYNSCDQVIDALDVEFDFYNECPLTKHGHTVLFKTNDFVNYLSA